MSADDFDLGACDALDEGRLIIIHPQTGAPTSWVWTFYGPGHAQTLALRDRLLRKALADERERAQAQANGRKWKADARSPDDVLAENVDNIIARVKDWSPVRIDGQTISYSPEATRALLLDPRKGWLLAQVGDYLRDDASFTKPSASS